MNIKTWKCDICGKEFKEGDAGWKNKSDLSLSIFRNIFDGFYKYKYDDVCYECRDKINYSIQNTIEGIKEETKNDI